MTWICCLSIQLSGLKSAAESQLNENCENLYFLFSVWHREDGTTVEKFLVEDFKERSDQIIGGQPITVGQDRHLRQHATKLLEASKAASIPLIIEPTGIVPNGVHSLFQ